MYAIVPAAGSSTRMGEGLGGRSKNLLTLPNGETVLGLTLRALKAAGVFAGIIVVGRQDDLPEMRQTAAKELGSLPYSVVVGGQNRQQSVYLGLQSVPSGIRHAAIHDAARPFCSAALITKVAGVALETGAAILAHPVTETVKRVDGNRITETVDREVLWLAQTPQVFSLELILKAHRLAEADGYTGTDDAELVERLGNRVSIVRGSRENIKITTPEDLRFAAALAEAV